MPHSISTRCSPDAHPMLTHLVKKRKKTVYKVGGNNDIYLFIQENYWQQQECEGRLLPQAYRLQHRIAQ